MWYELTATDSDGNPTTRSFSNEATDGVVEVTANGKFQVSADVGDALMERGFPARPVDESDENGDDDADDGGDVAADTADESGESTDE